MKALLEKKMNVRAYLTQFNESFFVEDRFLSLMWALILPAIFFSSQLFAPDPQFNFFGDLYNLYFPQFVEGYHLAKNGAFTGIDFLTNNGASAYFLRPNIPVFYPIYQLVYLLFSFETIEALARAYVGVLYAHSVIALYFSMRIGRKYFQLDNATSLLLGVLYFGAIANSYPIPPFYFVASLFPLLLYFALRSVEESAWWRLALYSFSYVLVFLSGYLPLDVNAVSLALLFAIVYFWQVRGEKQQILTRLIRLLVPVVLASVVVLPIYLAVLQYHKLVPGLPEGVWYAAHEFSYTSKDIFALLSRAFVGSRPGGGEFPSILLGVAPVLLLILAFTQRRKIALSPLEAGVVAISTLIFSFYLLLTFGRASGLPDLFYYLAPGLGKMHIYGRFLPIASFFFYLVFAIIFKHLIVMRSELPIARWISGLFVALIIVHGYGQLGQPESMWTELLSIELLMFVFILIGMSAHQSFYAYAGVISVSFFIHAANFNSHVNWSNLDAVPPHQNEVVFSQERRDALRNYFKEYADKKMIKFVDITSSIDKTNGVLLNYPWLVQDTVKLSNYMGYELHTSVDREYLARFPWFGKISVPWLLRTEADFVIYDPTAWSQLAGELEPFINHEVPEFDIGYGYKAAKLKDASGLVDYVPNRNPGDFDNGIVRVFNAAGTAAVSDFDTDFASHVRFEVDSSLPVTVRYLLFPNKMMELRIDGGHADVTPKDGLLEFSLPAGHHKIEYRYKNVLHQIFVKEYFLYLVALLGILGWRTWVVFTQLRTKKLSKGWWS
ncbi:hypothetical protein GALL_74920 [mine drainage metagenome]|uniref:Bacterial membrane protein YfhO n=1 Tax=mine drainage metagenome TaxID=410659 RepID=A0A1J5SQC6_9ZZZZ